jgi:hypothetical protein
MYSRQPRIWRMKLRRRAGGSHLIVSPFGGGNDFVGGEQAQVEVGRKQRVEKEVFPGLHGVLPGAEVGQALVDEVIKHLQGLGAGDGPAKSF